jgi:hypothetical protein
MTTPENAANTWLDLIDQLTPEQVAKIEASERHYRELAQQPKQWWSSAPRTEREIGDLMLSYARGYAANSLGVAMIGEVRPSWAARIGDIDLAHCRSVLDGWEQIHEDNDADTAAGYRDCYEIAWADDNPGYDVDARPAPRLKHVIEQAGNDC